MALCELANTCPFFNDKTAVQPATRAMMKARYCKGSQADCARYLVYLGAGREHVPADLAPTDRLRALGIVRAIQPRPAERGASGAARAVG